MSPATRAKSRDPEEEIAKEESSPARDRPKPHSLTRRVVLRDGRVCSNPFCRRKLGLQAHHIEFRSKRGKTVLSNETLVCGRCHSLLHKNLLSMTFQNEANPRQRLCWRTRGDEIQSSFEEDLKVLSTLGVGDIAWPSEPCAQDVFSTRVESKDAWATSPLVRGLRDLGYRKAEAPLRVNMAERLGQANERLRSRLGRAPSEEELLREALRPWG